MTQRKIVVLPYDGRWKEEFIRIKDELSEALGELAMRIEHVGSTAVPGLSAKPIIDIDVVIKDRSELADVVTALGKIGYDHAGDLGIPGREAFGYEGKTHLQKHHLYVCAASCAELKRHTAFRDYLMTHPEAVREYSRIKEEGARLYPYDIEKYIAHKAPFIEKVYKMIGICKPQAAVYVHGMGGNAAETEHFGPLFPGRDVIGFDYVSQTPWDAKKEFSEYFTMLESKYDGIVLIANSIGAFFSMCADVPGKTSRAYFISPIVDMEELILGAMASGGVTEKELEAKKNIKTPSGFELSWDYLAYVRENPVRCGARTKILYGSRDSMTPYGTMRRFAEENGASLTVMEGGEHWFHTEEQMRFLDRWIRRGAEE